MDSLFDIIFLTFPVLVHVELLQCMTQFSQCVVNVVEYNFTCHDFQVQLIDTKDVLNFLISKNLKDKKCNLFEIYLCLVLTENCLLFGTKPKPLVSELWSSFIRKCSVQISNTDFRPCAQEVIYSHLQFFLAFLGLTLYISFSRYVIEPLICCIARSETNGSAFYGDMWGSNLLDFQIRFVW